LASTEEGAAANNVVGGVAVLAGIERTLGS